MNETVPSEVLQRGELATARYLLRATPLGVFARTEEVRTLIAEDHLFSEIAPWIQVVNAMHGEEAFVGEWAKLRPQVHDPLRLRAITDLAGFGPFESAGAKLRLLVRMAAYRRLDAAYCGKQTYGLTPELGTDTYFFIQVPGVPAPIKVGTVISAVYEGDPKRDRELLDLCGNLANVTPVEHAIAGCFPAADTLAAWIDEAALMAELAPLRDWERTSKVSNLPNGWWFDLHAIPSGLALRPSAARLFANVGHEGGLTVLNRLGVSPFASAAAMAFFEKRAAKVSLLAQDDSVIEEFLASTSLVRDLVAVASQAA